MSLRPYSENTLSMQAAPVASGPCSGTLTTDAAIQAASGNPNFASQRLQWQNARKANGQEPKDWQALRGHVVGILAPDPGATPSQEFCSFGGRGGGGTPEELKRFFEMLQKQPLIAVAIVAAGALLYMQNSK